MEPDKPESAPSSGLAKAGGGSLIDDILRSEKKRAPAEQPPTTSPRREKKRGLPEPEPRQTTQQQQPDLFDLPQKPSETQERPTSIVSNQRRGVFALRVWLGSAVCSAAVVGAYAWFLNGYISQSIEQQTQPSPLAAIPSDLAQSLADTSRLATTNAADLTALQSQLGTLGAQFNALRQDISDHADRLAPPPAPAENRPQQGDQALMLKSVEQHLSQLDEQIKELSAEVRELTAVQKVESIKKTIPSNSSGQGVSSDEVTDELVLLKQRNRLTLLADEVMATGKSEPMRSLWAALRDPELSRLKHAATAEIIRVQNHLDRITRLPPDYRLPLKELFPDSSTASDDQLGSAELISLLRDQNKSLQIRARAALLLTGRKTGEVGDALVESMNSDPELDVVKECQHALRKTFGMAVPLFDSASAQDWWQKNRESASKPSVLPATAPSAPAP